MSQFKNFIQDETGMSEFLQLAIIIAIVAVIALAIVTLGSGISGKVEEAQSALDSITSI